MTIALFLALYVKTVLTDFVLILNPDEPFVVKEFDILEEQYEDEAILRQGAWFQYLPLISTIQAQSIGILDSNCFHLFSSVGKYSQTLNMLYYDCQDHEQMTITKYIKFMGNDDQQYNFEISINVFEYENQWYYFEFILFLQENRFQILLIKNEEILKNDILNVLPLKDQRTILKIGGDLVVVDSKLLNIANGDKFASFPGKIKAIDLSGSVVDFVDSAIYLGEPWEKQFSLTCVANPISSLINQDYVNLITSIYTSRFQNCDQFTFTGWFKINEIIQTHNVLTYQFIKLTSNVQNNLFQNQNISPLQLFYQLSKNLNTIIITTYSYTYPSITLDFTKDPFLITKEFQILNNMQLWHLLYVKLEREEFSVNLKFFENRQIYEYKTSIVVKQFHQIYFKLFLGNLQKSTNNYLNIISRNLYFFNCNKDFQQQNCHISCGECDGPTYQDCISCSIESKRIYFPEYKQCICPQDTVDHDDQCLGYPDFGFQLISGEEQNDECLYGQFELNGLCYQCPGQINSQITTCFECVQNPKDWYDNPFCNTFVYLNQDGRTTSLEQIYYQFAAKPYFIFNGVNLELCLECQQSSLTNQENINQDIAKKQELFNSFCLSKISGQQCSKCRIEYCTTCAIQQQDKSVFIVRNSRNQKMVSVQFMSMFCFHTMVSPGKLKENNCLSPYYISSTMECKKCSIENCIYCFEYVVDDLKLTTLYLNFNQFNGDDNIQVGCAMCNDGYVFDFRIGLCLKQTPKIDFCLRSYINQEGTEKCTLSSKYDFSVSREIINCEQFISNCLQCFLTVQQILRCIVCKEGYTTSTSEVNGQCNLSLKPNQLISIESNAYLKDAWVQRIQSFLGSFLPNSYFYPLSQYTFQVGEIAISCKEGYQLVKFKNCVQYCDSNCQDCKLNAADQFFCNLCPLDYFKQNQRVQINRICQSCQLLCAFCQSRNSDEINQAFPNFISTQDNELFSKKCYIPAQDPNILILPQKLVPIFCLDKSCKNHLFYQFNSLNCYDVDYIFVDLLTQANKKYLNQVGVLMVTVLLNFPNDLVSCQSGSTVDSTLLKQNVFSLNQVNLIIDGNYIEFRNNYDDILENFDSIDIFNQNIRQQNCSFHFGKNKQKLKMKNIQLIGEQITQNKLFLNSNSFSKIELVNITIKNINFNSSSFFRLDSLEFQSQVRIVSLLIQNSSFLNSNFIQIIDSELSMYIQKIEIVNCTLINSSLISIRERVFIQNIHQISSFTVKNCNLQESNLLYLLGQVKLEIVHLYLQGNVFQNSSFFINNYNTSIIDAIIQDNTLNHSNLMITNGINVTGYFGFFMDQFNIHNLILDNSNILQLSTSSLYQNLIIQLNNLMIFNLQRFDFLNNTNYVFQISNCFSLSINFIEIRNIKNITAFYFFQSHNILIENAQFIQDIKKNQVHYSQSCRQSKLLQNQFIHIEGFSYFKLQYAQIIDCQLVDSTIIEIISIFQESTNSREIIEIKDVLFKRNIIEQNQQSKLSLLSIYSERKQIIKIQNLQFINNFFHQYEDDLNENSAGLIYIRSTQGEIQAVNIQCIENAITNSSTSFIYIISESIYLNNYRINDHNIIIQELWSQFYKLEIDQQYDKYQISQIIDQIYPINTKGGAAKIVTEQFVCSNSIFQDIMTSTSAIFDIRTQGLGVIKLNNITSNQIFNTKRETNDNSGCININSQSSKLDLQLLNSNFIKVQNGMSTAILSVKPSQRETKISFQQIQIINCFSFLNQIFSIEFSTYNDQKKNSLSINNMNITFDENEWINYLSKFGELSPTEIAQIIDDNSIFNIFGGQIYINSFFIQGIIISPILKILNAYKLEMRDCHINDVESFYPLSLIILNQQSNLTMIFQKIEIQRFSIYQLNMERYQIETIPQFRVVGCQLQQLSQLTNFDSKILINENIKQLSNSSQKIHFSLINIINSNSESKLFFNQVKFFQNSCMNCTLGLLFLGLSDFTITRIHNLQCYQNQIQEYGCLYLKADQQNNKQQVLIENSIFIRNNGSQGSGIQNENLKLQIRQCKILENYALKNGGGMQLDIKNNQFKIYESIFLLNKAKIGGGIYFQSQSNLNQENFVNSILLFNQAEIYANNLVEDPIHLSISINQMELPQKKLYLENKTFQVLAIKPYKIIEQGQVLKAEELMIPSNQEIKNYKIYHPKFSTFKNYIQILSIHFKNRFNEKLENLDNSSCLIESTINFQNNSMASSERTIQNLVYDQDVKALDLSSLSFSFDPYFQDNKHLSILLSCKVESSKQALQYYIYAKTFKCQQGEFYVDKGCQLCSSTQGFYSVTYNSTKCSIFDKEKFDSITSNKIKLLEGYWRPNYLSDFTEKCAKNPNYCSGGWDVGNNLCVEGHLGGLCEECDNFDIRGFGMFYKNVQNVKCFGCQSIQDSVLPFVLTSTWALISILITLRSIEKSNKLFSSLKIRQRFSKIIFKLDQDHESILIKMLLNYLWIFSVIFTFNTNFSFSLNFIELTSNSSFYMANNLDCYLSSLQNLELIYIRIIAMLILIAIQLLIIWIGFACYAKCKNWTFNKSIISNTLLYLYVSNYAALIKQLCSIVSKRAISTISYIQGDVSLIYGTDNHIFWIIILGIPGLGVFGALIPFTLFFVMYMNREQLDKIKLRRHICYLFNEYNQESYYWEQIKLSKKTIIIIILTFFESDVLLMASLLGLCLLFYQLLAVNQKPYIIQSLNFLDIQTGQICSISIFISAVKYVSEKGNVAALSILLQIFIILLCMRLCYPFIINIFRVYFKKYKLPFIEQVYKILRSIKADCFLSRYLNNQLRKLNNREYRRKTNFAKLRNHLISLSKLQIGHQKQMVSMMNSQSTIRYRQIVTITDVEMNKLTSP